MGDKFCEVCGNPVENIGEFCSSACGIKYRDDKIKMLAGAIEGCLSTDNALRDRHDRAVALLRDVMRDSEDVQPGMVLEFLGSDIRALLAEEE